MSAMPPAAGPAVPSGVAPATGMAAPGRVLGLVGLIVALVFSPAGIVVSIVALVQSRRAGVRNGFALGGLITGIVVTLFWIAFVLAIVFLVVVPITNECAQLGPGVHQVGPTRYTCS